MVVRASAAVGLSGNDQWQVFVNRTALALHHLTVTHGYSAGSGGGILNASFTGAVLTVTDSTISENRAKGSGGGISSGGRITVTGSTISGNRASLGGGIYHDSSGSELTVTGSTISGNTHSIDNAGGSPSLVVVQNSIVVGACDNIADGGYNVVYGSVGCLIPNRSSLFVDPRLDPAGLQDNGGPTKTIALQEESPAIDAIEQAANGCATDTTQDQRGKSRLQDGDNDGTASCDIGAFEKQDESAPAAPTITSPPQGSYDRDGSFTLSGTAEANSAVELFEGTTSAGTDQADSSGEWSIDLTGVPEGSHPYKAKATGAVGNTSVESEARTVIVDTTAPAAPRINSPADNSFDTDGTIVLSGTAEEGATVEIFELTASGPTSKGTAPVDSSGAWAKALTGVPNGSHAYTAKATDAAGNTSAESAGRSVKVDTRAPSVMRVAPQVNATGIAPAVNVSAAFSEPMRATSVKNAFRLYKKGSRTAIEAKVTYDGATNKAVLDPTANLERGATYKAVISTAAKDLAGNALDQNPSVTGNQQKVWYFTISP